jgi:hypothetical protein
MTKIDIFSGFLGAGKTTLIKKLIQEAYTGEKVVLIENEFGEIGIDGGFLQEAGINITEMNSGCICCSLVGDFSQALQTNDCFRTRSLNTRAARQALALFDKNEFLPYGRLFSPPIAPPNEYVLLRVSSNPLFLRPNRLPLSYFALYSFAF